MALPFAKSAAAPAKPIKVGIVYCASCGYQTQALELISALMRTFIYELSEIEIIPWQDGAFDVIVDGDLIHSMYEQGGFPTPETVVAAVRERLARQQAKGATADRLPRSTRRARSRTSTGR
ncbi:SelT/SelW/SelH family protein [Candidatus Gracilibacteria bacterium]|nr:SelT/SelW/SelH family protein [Candidatus Gracilibacteria bacterium]